MLACRALYHELKDDTQCDPYKLAVLNLITCAEPAVFSLPDSTLEDFLWAQTYSTLVSG
jgi:hypothetical protein